MYYSLHYFPNAGWLMFYLLILVQKQQFTTFLTYNFTFGTFFLYLVLFPISFFSEIETRGEKLSNNFAVARQGQKFLAPCSIFARYDTVNIKVSIKNLTMEDMIKPVFFSIIFSFFRRFIGQAIFSICYKERKLRSENHKTKKN